MARKFRVGDIVRANVPKEPAWHGRIYTVHSVLAGRTTKGNGHFVTYRCRIDLSSNASPAYLQFTARELILVERKLPMKKLKKPSNKEIILAHYDLYNDNALEVTRTYMSTIASLLDGRINAAVAETGLTRRYVERIFNERSLQER